MSVISFRMAGKLFSDGERAALLFVDGGKSFSLRLGFVLQGSDEPFLPETLLDDWGHEVGGVELYQWVRENGAHFPRAELFGFDLLGRPQQCFVRELDLAAKYLCYVVPHDDRSSENAIRVGVIILPGEGAGQRRLNAVPSSIPFPLREAEVIWWTLDPARANSSDYDFYDDHELNETDQ